MRRVVVLLAIVLTVSFLISCGVYYYFKTSAQANKLDNNQKQTLVGNDRDKHGCIGSAGYSWCKQKNKCLRIWEETCD